MLSQVALSARLREGELTVVDDLTSESFGTSAMVDTLAVCLGVRCCRMILLPSHSLEVRLLSSKAKDVARTTVSSLQACIP